MEESLLWANVRGEKKPGWKCCTHYNYRYL